ncbi:MAG: 5-bromo-4-chloroindolyl phosphate hydrolysis family protein, partial [Lachnospiraceae bacterium]|nr:5-bromo-4-chloroindolyl phosphate hydrolysis family protein [Lachnospiraceae bacterium]
MDRNEWYRAGEDIRDQVQQAVDSGNFTDLGKNIGNTVNDTINRTVREMNRTVGTVGDGVNRTVGIVGDSLNRAVNEVGRSIEQIVPGNNGSIYANRPQYRHPNTRPDTRLFQSVPRGSVSGVICMLAGYGWMGFSMIAVIGSVGDLILYSDSLDTLITAVFFSLAGFALGFHGTKLVGRAKRYGRYVDMVKERLYCSIQEMAAKIGKSEKFVVNDLKKMIQLGMFKQGRLDQRETCLIASDEMYQRYMLTQKSYEQEQMKRAEQERVEEQKRQEKERLGEAGKVIEEGKSYVRLIRQCNDEIPGEEMSDKLDRLELLVTRIFDQVEKEPELAPELRKMLSFYLPTTKKLLEAYRDLDRQQVELSNIEQTKR